MDHPNKAVLLERCAGYYDGVRGVLFLDATGRDHHFITDYHEGTHRWLAENSVLGSLYRFFSITKERAQREISADALGQIDLLLEELTKSSFLPHEISATYLSFYACRRFYPEQLQAALRVLPPDYKDFLDLGVSAFGALEAGLTDAESNNLAEIVRYLAMAAMSPPIDAIPVDIRLDNLAEFIRFSQDHSGNARFRQILAKANPPGVPGLVSDCMVFRTSHDEEISKEQAVPPYPGMEYSSIVRFVFDQVEHTCPGIHIAKKRSDIEKWAHDFFGMLQRSLQMQGSRVLDDIQMVDPTPQHDWIADYFSQELSVVAPITGDRVPFFDSAVSHPEYQPANAELIGSLVRMREAHEFVIHGFLAPLSASDPLARNLKLTEDGCLLLGNVWGAPTDIPPFMVTLNPSQIESMIQGLPKRSLVLRGIFNDSEAIRSLLPDHAKKRLLYFSVPNSSTNDVAQLLCSQPRSWTIGLSINQLPQLPAFLIQVVPSRAQVLILPTTPARFTLLASKLDECSDHTVVSGLDKLAEHGVDGEELQAVIMVMSAALLKDSS